MSAELENIERTLDKHLLGVEYSEEDDEDYEDEEEEVEEEVSED